MTDDAMKNATPVYGDSREETVFVSFPTLEDHIREEVTRAGALEYIEPYAQALEDEAAARVTAASPPPLDQKTVSGRLPYRKLTNLEADLGRALLVTAAVREGLSEAKQRLTTLPRSIGRRVRRRLARLLGVETASVWAAIAFLVAMSLQSSVMPDLLFVLDDEGHLLSLIVSLGAGGCIALGLVSPATIAALYASAWLKGSGKFALFLGEAIVSVAIGAIRGSLTWASLAWSGFEIGLLAVHVAIASVVASRLADDDVARQKRRGAKAEVVRLEDDLRAAKEAEASATVAHARQAEVIAKREEAEAYLERRVALAVASTRVVYATTVQELLNRAERGELETATAPRVLSASVAGEEE